MYINEHNSCCLIGTCYICNGNWILIEIEWYAIVYTTLFLFIDSSPHWGHAFMRQNYHNLSAHSYTLLGDSEHLWTLSCLYYPMCFLYIIVIIL